MTESEDYYQLLGVAYSANKQEITKAYRVAMKRAHPDRRAPEHRAGAEERAKLLNTAYAVLTNPDKRRAYDESIRVKLVQNEVMSHYFGGFGAPGGLSGDPTGETFKRATTTGERQERRHADRGAMLTVLLAFGGLTIALLVLLLLWAGLSALVSWLF